MVSWEDVKKSGLPALVMLPPMLWLGLCLSGLNLVAMLLVLVGRQKDFLKVAEFSFSCMHRPFLFLLPWSGSKVFFYGIDAKAIPGLGFDQSMALLNHRGNLDWLMGLYLNDCGYGIGCSKAIVKKSLIYVPIIGFIWWCADFVCITRDWKSASAALLEAYKRQHIYKAHGIPYCLCLFPEGTRITPKKLADAQEFERQNNLRVFKNVLCPRVKGLWSALQGLQLDSITDMTVAEAGSSKANFITLARGKPAEFHVHISRLDPKTIPKDQEDLKKWLFDRWALKEDLLEKFEKEGKFGDDRVCDIPLQPTVHRSMIGTFLFWAASCLCFTNFCLANGYTRLLISTFAGSAAVILLFFAVVVVVHLKPH